jgi:hypothetical protein
VEKRSVPTKATARGHGAQERAFATLQVIPINLLNHVELDSQPELVGFPHQA